LNVRVLLDKFANLVQVDCINPCIASLIFLALDLVIGPFGTCKGSLRFGPPFPSLFKKICPQIVTYINWRKIRNIESSRDIILTWKIHFISIIINFLKDLERFISSRMRLSPSMGWKSFFVHVNAFALYWLGKQTFQSFARPSYVHPNYSLTLEMLQ
jgi:hypothetical protein